jgi:hypothetical protein
VSHLDLPGHRDRSVGARWARSAVVRRTSDGDGVGGDAWCGAGGAIRASCGRRALCHRLQHHVPRWLLRGSRPERDGPEHGRGVRCLQPRADQQRGHGVARPDVVRGVQLLLARHRRCTGRPRHPGAQRRQPGAEPNLQRPREGGRERQLLTASRQPVARHHDRRTPGRRDGLAGGGASVPCPCSSSPMRSGAGSNPNG